MVRLGDSRLAADFGGIEAPDKAHAVIRPERVGIEEFGSAGPNRVPGMVERLIYLGSTTQIMIRLAPGMAVQALVQNDGSSSALVQGTPVHVHLASDALRVLTGDDRADSEDEFEVAPVAG